MKLSSSVASTMLSAWNTLYNGGTLVMLSGTEPTTPETAESGNTALATFTFSATAFGTPSLTSPEEIAIAAFTASTVSPTVSGTDVFARAFSSASVALADYTVGVSGSGADIIIGTTTITTGTNVTISSFTHEIPAY